MDDNGAFQQEMAPLNFPPDCLLNRALGLWLESFPNSRGLTAVCISPLSLDEGAFLRGGHSLGRRQALGTVPILRCQSDVRYRAIRGHGPGTARTWDGRSADTLQVLAENRVSAAKSLQLLFGDVQILNQTAHAWSLPISRQKFFSGRERKGPGSLGVMRFRRNNAVCHTSVDQLTHPLTTQI